MFVQYQREIYCYEGLFSFILKFNHRSSYFQISSGNKYTLQFIFSKFRNEGMHVIHILQRIFSRFILPFFYFFILFYFFQYLHSVLFYFFILFYFFQYLHSVQYCLLYNCGIRRVHIGVEMKQGECACPLSCSVYCNFVRDGNRVKGGRRASPMHPRQPGLIFPSWWNARQKSAVATLCTLWRQNAAPSNAMFPCTVPGVFNKFRR